MADPLLTNSFPLYNGPGLVILFLMHLGPVEYVYYWLHRALHHHYLYSRYHSHHHASFVTEAISGKREGGKGERVRGAVRAVGLMGAPQCTQARMMISIVIVGWIGSPALPCPAFGYTRRFLCRWKVTMMTNCGGTTVLPIAT